MLQYLQYNAYPTASWVDLGWGKASNGVTMKIMSFSNILRLLVVGKKDVKVLKLIPSAVIPLPVTMKRKIKKPLVKSNFR